MIEAGETAAVGLAGAAGAGRPRQHRRRTVALSGPIDTVTV